MSGKGAADIMGHLPIGGATQFLFDGVEGRLSFGEFEVETWVDVDPRDPFGWSFASDQTNIGPLEIDTGTPVIYLPRAEYDAWLYRIPFRFLEQDGVLYIDCDAEAERLPPVDIKLAGDPFPVQGSNLLGNRLFTHPETQMDCCYSLVQCQDSGSDDEASDDDDAAPPEDALIGLPFFAQYDVVYDTDPDEPKVGIRRRT